MPISQDIFIALCSFFKLDRKKSYENTLVLSIIIFPVMLPFCVFFHLFIGIHVIIYVPSFHPKELPLVFLVGQI